jgi:acyl carrier protein
MMTSTSQSRQPDRVAEAVEWIVGYLTKRLDNPPSALQLEAPFSQLGIDSMFAVVMSEDISAWTGVESPSNLLYQYPTINELARYIAALK